jgi:hypothetical protein
VLTVTVGKLHRLMRMLDNRQLVNSRRHQDLRVTVGMSSLMMVGVSITSGTTMVVGRIKAWTATSAVVFDAMALGHIY